MHSVKVIYGTMKSASPCLQVLNLLINRSFAEYTDTGIVIKNLSIKRSCGESHFNRLHDRKVILVRPLPIPTTYWMRFKKAKKSVSRNSFYQLPYSKTDKLEARNVMVVAVFVLAQGEARNDHSSLVGIGSCLWSWPTRSAKIKWCHIRVNFRPLLV